MLKKNDLTALIASSQYVINISQIAERVYDVLRRVDLDRVVIKDANQFESIAWQACEKEIGLSDSVTFGVVKSIIDSMKSSFRVFTKEELLSNPYFNAVNGKEINTICEDISLQWCEPLIGFIVSNPKKEDGVIPMFDCVFTNVRKKELVLSDRQSVWMSVSPNEIITMQEPIKNAFGNVLILGLGIGYFPYMISQKDNIKSITIVENNPNVIKIFKEVLQPILNIPNLRIVENDAVEFLTFVDDGEYDYCFVDIWRHSGDILNYYRCKEVGNAFKRTVIDYWIEDSFIQILKGTFYIALAQAAFDESGNTIDGTNLIDETLDSLFSEDVIEYTRTIMYNYMEVVKPLVKEAIDAKELVDKCMTVDIFKKVLDML